jgi:CopG family nickel-responsive transcriptional regulator
MVRLLQDGGAVRDEQHRGALLLQAGDGREDPLDGLDMRADSTLNERSLTSRSVMRLLPSDAKDASILAYWAAMMKRPGDFRGGGPTASGMFGSIGFYLTGRRRNGIFPVRFLIRHMSKLVRFGVSLGRDLLDRFDALVAERGYASRSEAFRDLIRSSLVEEEWRAGSEVAGAVTIVYDHHKKDLVHRVTDIQHEVHGLIISTQHIHLDHDHCLEIIAVRGSAAEVRRLADALRAVKGVLQGSVNMASTGRKLD